MPLVLLILLAASLLHWRRSGQRFQGLFAAALVFLLLGVISQYLGLAPLRGRAPADIRSGAVQPDAQYLQASNWLTNLGLVLAALGGLTTLFTAYRPRSLPPPASAGVDRPDFSSLKDVSPANSGIDENPYQSPKSSP